MNAGWFTTHLPRQCQCTCVIAHLNDKIARGRGRDVDPGRGRHTNTCIYATAVRFLTHAPTHTQHDAGPPVPEIYLITTILNVLVNMFFIEVQLVWSTRVMGDDRGREESEKVVWFDGNSWFLSEKNGLFAFFFGNVGIRDCLEEICQEVTWFLAVYNLAGNKTHKQADCRTKEHFSDHATLFLFIDGSMSSKRVPINCLGTVLIHKRLWSLSQTVR